MEDFIRKFTEQFIDADDLKIEEETNFRDIDSYDSLTGMAIIMMIEDNYGVTISEKEFKKFNTPEELFEYIKKISKE